MKIMDAKRIQDFLSNFNGSTYISYKSYLKKYFEWLDTDPDIYIVNMRELEHKEYFKQLDKYEKNVTNFWKCLMDENYAPKSIKAIIACIRVFLQEHRIKLDEIVWRNINRRGNGSSSVITDKTPTHSMLRQMLTHADTKGRAFFLMTLSSGLRPDEVTHLKTNDIEFGNPEFGEPSKILIPGKIAKNKKRAITFITPEATNAVNEWLKIRRKYLITKQKRTPKTRTFKNRGITIEAKINLDDNRLFPFSENNAGVMWETLLKKTGYDKIDTSTKRKTYVYRLYTLRKFFKRNFKDESSEVFLNHSENLLSIYKNLDEDDLKKIYTENMGSLLIFEKPIETNEVIKNQQKQIDQLQGHVKNLMERMDEVIGNYEKELQKEIASHQFDVEYLSKSPEKREEVENRLKKVLEEEKEKEALKSPEQKAKEQREIEKKLKGKWTGPI